MLNSRNSSGIIAGGKIRKPGRRAVSAYAAAIDWTAHNDDLTWLDGNPPIPNATAAWIAEKYGKPMNRVVGDLRRARDHASRDVVTGEDGEP